MVKTNARNKLNGAFFNAAFVAGLTLGAATESFLVGMVTFGVFIAVAINSGDIRLAPRNRKHQ